MKRLLNKGDSNLVYIDTSLPSLNSRMKAHTHTHSPQTHMHTEAQTCTHILIDSHADTHVIWVQSLVLVGYLCLTLCNPKDYIAARPLCPWNFPGKNTGVHCHFLLQGNFPAGYRTWVTCFAGSLYHLRHQGSPW